MHGGQQAVQSLLMRWLPGFQFVWDTLKLYFAVDTAYVTQKLTVLAAPFRHKDWQRKTDSRHPGTAVAAAPVEDVNAPDLYIPAMAFVTYVIVVGLSKGMSMKCVGSVRTAPTLIILTHDDPR